MAVRFLRAPLRRAIGLCLLAVCADACRKPPAGPSPLSPPSIVCPASQTIAAPNNAGLAVSFTPPATADGEAPLTVDCTTLSGATFPIGTTPVFCTVIDARRRSATCEFAVTVTAPPPPPIGPPVITVNRFLAFGDSITEGKSGECARSTASGLFVHDPFGFFTRAVPPGNNYPTKLQNSLAATYAAQAPVVVNEGLGGEQVTPRETEFRLAGAIGAHAPQVLLLLEGVNDLHAGVSINAMVGSLRSLVRETQERGIEVMLGALLPQRSGSCRAFAVDSIAPANSAIRAMAAGEGVPVVDTDMAFAGGLDVLLGEDGLHPTDAGYETIARTFFAAIKSRFERPATTTHAR